VISRYVYCHSLEHSTLMFLIKKVPLSYFTPSTYLEQVALVYFY